MQHGVQLGITDVIYKKDIQQESDAEAEAEDLVDVEEDTNNDAGFRIAIRSREVDLAVEYRSIIEKLRKLVKLFRKSPTKNDALQIYIKEEFGHAIQLELDCKTRWSSLANMITTYNRTKQCVSKTLIDLGYGSTSDHFFNDEEHAVLVDATNF